MFIVQGKSREPAGIVKVTKASRQEALETASDFQHQGLPFVTIIGDGRVYTAEEFALTVTNGDALGAEASALASTRNEQSNEY
ncbi:MAG TPA: hypothetical protein VKB08_22590 [Bradyrhizobium sp.]|nr:hypothetical protein [Bradyrhizobium sp.]